MTFSIHFTLPHYLAHCPCYGLILVSPTDKGLSYLMAHASILFACNSPATSPPTCILPTLPINPSGLSLNALTYPGLFDTPPLSLNYVYSHCIFLHSSFVLSSHYLQFTQTCLYRSCPTLFIIVPLSPALIPSECLLISYILLFN